LGVAGRRLGGARLTAQALARPGIVSLDLRTHKQRVFPLGDLAALSPEGRRVAVAENPDNKECLLYVHRLDGSHDHVLVQTAFPLCPGYPRWWPAPAFATTNRYGQGRVFVFDPGRAKPLRAVTPWVYGPVASIAWSRDWRCILFARTAG
jgi:hypothetical protein